VCVSDLSRALRTAVRFVCDLLPESVAIIARTWRDYKVMESPIPVKLLASSFLKKRPVCEAKNWEAWLCPEPVKYVWWLSRVTEAFAARVARANAEMQGRQVTLRTRAGSFRDKFDSSETVFNVSMAWAAWQSDIKALVSVKKLTELNAMFTRGNLP